MKFCLSAFAHQQSKRAGLSGSPSMFLQDLTTALKPSTKLGTSCLMPRSPMVFYPLRLCPGASLAGRVRALLPNEPLLQRTSCPSYLKHTLDSPPAPGPQPQRWFLRVGLWKELPSLRLAVCTVPASSCQSHYSMLLCRRHRHAEATSSQPWEPSIATDGSKCCAQVWQPYS